MHLVEILLPLFDNWGHPIPAEQLRTVSDELTRRFGGLTAFTRSPAEGRWSDGGSESHDDIVVLEVMTESVDRAWWANYRKDLEARFGQEEIVIRAHPIERL